MRPYYHPWIALLTTVIGFAVGVTILLWIDRRRFYRRNAAGIQEFKNYRRCLFSRLAEGFLHIIAILCFMASYISVVVAMFTPYKYW